MGTYSYTITPDGSSAYTFAQVVPGPGIFALNDMTIGPPARELLRFHPRGVKGNVIVRDEVTGRLITCRALFSGVFTATWQVIQNMFTAFRAYPCTIADVGGMSWTKCNLLEAKIVSTKGDGTDENGNAEFTVEMTFTKDQDF